MKELTEPMKKVLRIMAEGHEIEVNRYGDALYYDYVPVLAFSVSLPPRPGDVATLLRDKLIERLPRKRAWSEWTQERYGLTEAGHQAAQELANA